MGKWSKYEKRYCPEWEKDATLKNWIQKVPADVSKVYCKYCRCEMRAHKGDLMTHAATDKHKRNAAPFSNMRTVFDTGIKPKTVDISVKKAELKLAAHIACHSSIQTVDHLGELVHSISGKDLAIHRTKCTALIKRVIGPSVHLELIQDIQNVPFSLIIDESTDIKMMKQLCIIVRYYSAKLSKVVTTFLGLIVLEAGTAEAVFNSLLKFLGEKRLLPANCIGLATDGCNTMSGNANSVITRFRELTPGIVHIKCICHSIQLCSSYALKVMPRNVEFMVAETYNWFSHSTARQQRYHAIYSCINVGEEPLKILKLSDTRWLSTAPCVQRILDQYEELNCTFNWQKTPRETIPQICCTRCTTQLKISCIWCF